MKKRVLKNGLTILYEKKKGNSVVIEVMIKVGSNHENQEERGISHFLEHILFEGTKKRPSNQQISNEIEKIGGDFNAYTTNEKTCFYVKVLKKHFPIAVDILADILQNSLFSEKDILKEKKVVLKEIDMIYDEPRYYQWVLLQSTLFEKHPCRNPTYGDKNVVKNLTQEKLVKFYDKYYVPNNMTISIVGDVQSWKKEIQKKFIAKKGTQTKFIFPTEPNKNKTKSIINKRRITNTFLAMGFKSVPRNHRDSYILDVINGVMGRGQSGKMFTEIRSKRGLAYDVGTQNLSEKSFGYFAIYATIDKKNVNLVKKLILKELKSLIKINNEELQEAQDFIEGDYLLEIEDTQKVADQLLYWELVKDAKLMNEYIKKIKKVTINDIRRVVGKYFKNQTTVVLEGK